MILVEHAVNGLSTGLSGRSQKVVLLGESSSNGDVHSWVPQGLVLGLTLFNIFINDLEVNIKLLLINL